MPLHTKLCMLLLLFSLPGFGQSDVEGVVRNELTERISGATVSIQEVGNTQPKQTKTDGNGKFKFNLSNGAYTLMVSFQGYSTYHKSDIQVADNAVDLGTIQLIPAHQSIEAIQVTGQKRLIEHKSDRMVINIENSILADGMTALEILQRAPAVKVDDDGNINMRGKSDVAVMINGKLSYLAPKDLATLLKGTPSSSLKSIELITNPSAKYDAQGMGGIINIQMKAERKSGFNVSVNSFGGAGRKERYGAGVNMNAQSGKWNLMLGYDHGFRGEEEYRNFDRYFPKNPQEEFSRKSIQYSTTSEPLRTNNAKLGLDFQANEKLYFGIGWTGSFGTYKNFNNGFNDILFSNEERISNSLTDNSNVSKWNTNTLNFNFQQQFGSQDHTLSGDFEFLHADYKADQVLLSDFQETAHQKPFLSKRVNKTPSLTKLYVGKLDYLHHLSNQQVLEVGWKSSFMNADNNAINDTLKAGQMVRDMQTSNHFLYEEQIHAGYVNYKLDLEEWNLTAGLRMEQTASLGNQLTAAIETKRNYLNWFPSASISKKWGERHNLQASYSRRINRPDYDDLNPFRYYVDAFVFFEGNPLLQPELANSYELNYGYGKNLHLSLFFTDVSDVMTSVLTQIPAKNQTIRSRANIEGFRNIGASLNHSYNPVFFWTTINNASTFQNHYFGSFNQEAIENKQWSYTVQSNNIFKLPKAWSFELNGQYNSAESDGVFERKGFGFVSAGIMKKVWQDKLSLKLAANDIFKTMKYQTESHTGSVRMNQHFNLDSRTFIFSLSLKIGKEGKMRTRETDSAEQQRVRGGS